MGEKTAVDVAFLPAALEAVHSSARETRRQGLEHLVRRLQDGDPAALEPFIRETQGVAWRLAYSYLQDRHCCEDALQEVYLAVYRHIGQLRDPRAVHTWLCRIVANRCRRLLRRRRADSLEELAENGVAPAVTGMAEQAEAGVEVRRAFARLSRQDREVLTLREILQFTYEEIASALGVPIGTVRSRLSKARQRLLRVLEEGTP